MVNRTVYFLKRPRKGRRTFAVIQRTTPPSGDVVHSTLKDDRVEAINQAMLSGAIHTAEADLQLTQLVKELHLKGTRQKRGLHSCTEENQKLLTAYWESAYSRTKIRAKDSAKYRLVRALVAIDPHSLLGDVHTLQKTLDKNCAGKSRRQRTLAAALNQMREHFGLTRDRLELEPEVRPQFRFLTEKELEAVLPFVEGYTGKKPCRHVSAEVVRALFRTLFCSGARVSEAYAFTDGTYSRDSVSIDGQLSRRAKPSVTRTKTGRSRTAAYLPQGMAALQAWVAYPNKADLCRHSLSRILKNACKKAFPNRPDKWVCVHDLRHSYAVHFLVVLDYRIDEIARALGNGVQVCEKHYLNFAPERESVQATLHRRIKQSEERLGVS